MVKTKQYKTNLCRKIDVKKIKNVRCHMNISKEKKRNDCRVKNTSHLPYRTVFTPLPPQSIIRHVLDVQARLLSPILMHTNIKTGENVWLTNRIPSKWIVSNGIEWNGREWKWKQHEKWMANVNNNTSWIAQNKWW